MRWRKNPQEERMADLLRKERNNRKKEEKELWGRPRCVWGGREREVTGRDNYIRVPRNCIISTTDIGILSMI